jgi:hydroxymethylpyrimidine pyrophosphatase-like HAD family hydrolase
LERIATLGDWLNDVLMFQRSGLSIAMGNLLTAIVERANTGNAWARRLRTFMA